jgi:hypothetical protein
VYYDVNDAYPLHLASGRADVSTQVSFPESISADVRAMYESKINGLLFMITDQNQSLMMLFRSIYITYSSNPCKHSDFLLRQSEIVMEDHRKIHQLKIKISAFVQLAQGNHTNPEDLTRIFNEIVTTGRFGDQTLAASRAIAENRQIAQDLMRRD